MTGRKSFLRLALLLCGAVVPPASAGEFSPGDYVHLQIRIKEVSAVGIAARLEERNSGRADSEAIERIRAQTRSRIEDALSTWGVSRVEYNNYGARNKAAIQSWLDANQAWRRRLEEVEQRLSTLTRKLEQRKD